MNKSQREAIKQMFCGHCAYCGVVLPDKWHVDHFEPIIRKLKYVAGKGLKAAGGSHRPENDCDENCMPACPRCNISKGSLTIEQWRVWIVGHVKSLNAHHTPYKIAKSFGLIKETSVPVQFYFEHAALSSQRTSGEGK